MKAGYARQIITLVIFACLVGCGQGLQRGMMGTTYISTARPDIAISVQNLPMLTAGQGICNLEWTGVMGGLPIDIWLAVYGEGALAPMAIVAQAQTPQGWQWDDDSQRPITVDQGTAVIGGMDFDACTYTVDPANDPFGLLVTGRQPDGAPQLWLARSFMARCNFNQDKIILEYREPLPAGVASLTALPIGQDSLLRDFAKRASQTFSIARAPAGAKAERAYTNNIQWQYMGQRFLGTVSRLSTYLRD